MDEIAEAELADAGRTGAVVMSGVGATRAVRGTLLRKLCYELADQVDPRGLRLSQVVVLGVLDLAGLRVPFPLWFDGCDFESAPVLEGAELSGLSFVGCPQLPGLLGNGLRLRRDLDLSGSRVAGAHWTNASTSKQSAIWLCEADISGRLLCAGTEIDGRGGRSIQADRLRVGGVVRLIHQFSSIGEIRLVGARINGSLDLTGARIESSDGPAIDLENAVIGGSVFLIGGSGGRRPVIGGRFELGSARIAGRLVIRDATLRAHAADPSGSAYARSAAPGTAISADRLSVGAAVTFAGNSEVSGRIDLSMSEMSTLLVGARCALKAPGRTALDLTNAEIRALFRVDADAAVEGTVRLAGAAVHGTLALHGKMSHPERRTLIGASAMTVDGDAYLNGLRTDGGTVTFRGATIGSLSADGAHLNNPGGYSLRLSQAHVKGSVRLINGFTSIGLVALNRTTIDGRLMFTGGTFTCPAPAPANEHGHAIEAISAAVAGGMDLGWEAISPSADFTDAATTFLADDPAKWPSRFTIAGFKYDRFETPQGTQFKQVWDQIARSAWLGRQTTFDSGTYEHAAKVFRQHGYTSEAEQILIAQRRRARRIGRDSATWQRRAMDLLYAAVGYGYRPSRVLWLVAALLVLVTASLELPGSQATLRATTATGAIYSTTGPLRPQTRPLTSASLEEPTAQTDSCGDGAVRCFSPVLYAIDTVIPLVSLDQRSTWYPDPHIPGGQILLWWLNLATLMGWLLSSIFVLSLARLARNLDRP